jgi:flavodoxin
MQAKIGILYITDEGEKVWKTHYEPWQSHRCDMDDMLNDIFNLELKGIGEGNLNPMHVVCLGTVDDEDGKYFCKKCESYFEDFDTDIGADCCPYCSSLNWKIA